MPADSSRIHSLAAWFEEREACSLSDLAARAREVSLHLAIVDSETLDDLRTGRKGMESRFSKTRQPPWKRIAAGDGLIFKVSGGPARLVAEAGAVEFHGPLEPGRARELMEEKAGDLRCSPDFIRKKADARYGTLIRIAERREIQPTAIEKRDPRPWVCFEPGE